MCSKTFIRMDFTIRFVVLVFFGESVVHHTIETHDNAALHVLYYMNYLLKFYEFVDTYVILLKKRPLIFLHWYHHASNRFSLCFC